MMEEASQALLLLEALGIGLLIGIERERNGGEKGSSGAECRKPL